MKINNYGTEYDVTIVKTRYFDGNFAIALMCSDDYEPYGNLTVNLGERLPENMAYVDTNNMPNAERFIKDNKLGKFTGKTRKSGYCEYPLYEFNFA